VIAVRGQLEHAIADTQTTALDQGIDGPLGGSRETRGYRGQVREVGLLEDLGRAVGQLEEAAGSADQDFEGPARQ
jgi:hypothetical protein